MPSNPQHICVEENGHLLAEATVYADVEHRMVRADLPVEAGHLPVGTRTRLVDAVLNQCAAQAGTQLKVTLPVGDGEILDRLRQRCDNLQTRAAGASTLATGAVARN